MRLKLYKLFVNKQPGIKARYHKAHDNATGIQKVLSWVYLLWLNFSYYVLFCRFSGRVPAMEMFEEKNLHIERPHREFVYHQMRMIV